MVGKKIFFTVLYRTPSCNHTSPEFQDFLSKFETLYSNIKTGNPLATFFTGDFNAHSQLWWPDGDTNPEGTKIEELFSQLGLSQLISEPTNFEPHKNPSLVVTDQPNIYIFFSLCIFSQVRNIPERIILISTTGLR